MRTASEIMQHSRADAHEAIADELRAELAAMREALRSIVKAGNELYFDAETLLNKAKGIAEWALKAAQPAPAVEPVAWMKPGHLGPHYRSFPPSEQTASNWTPLYASPTPAITDEMDRCYCEAVGTCMCTKPCDAGPYKPSITDEMVEAGARAMLERQGWEPAHIDNMKRLNMLEWRNAIGDCRFALTAALRSSTASRDDEVERLLTIIRAINRSNDHPGRYSRQIDDLVQDALRSSTKDPSHDR